MAIDNLNFYNTGLPAGQLTDRYSSQPGCLRSKNLDIFSSSKSVKATAWGTESRNSNVVDVDPTGRFELRSDCTVWDYVANNYAIRPTQGWNVGVVNKIYYNPSGTSAGTSESPSKGTPQKLFVERNDAGTDRASIVVVSTTQIFCSYKNGIVVKPTLSNLKNCTLQSDGGLKVDSGVNYIQFDVGFDHPGFFWAGFVLRKVEPSTSSLVGDLTIDNGKTYQPNLIYDENKDALSLYSRTVRSVEYPGGQYAWWGYNPSERAGIGSSGTHGIVVGDCFGYRDGTHPTNGAVRIRLNVVKEDNAVFNGTLYVDPYDSVPVYGYSVFIPKLTNRLIKQLGTRYAIGNTRSAGVYAFEPVYYENDGDVEWDTLKTAQFLQESALPYRKQEEIADVVMSDTMIYKFANRMGTGYITAMSIDDPAGDSATTTTYPGIKFIGAARHNSIIYIIAEDRGVSGLYGYNGVELVLIMSANQMKNQTDLIDNHELFKFNRICMWRGNVAMTSSDNKVWLYGNTYGGKGISSIYSPASSESITGITATDETLSITTTISGTNYVKRFQNSKAIKNYLTEWEAVYPIVIGNHLLEKEESDLYASYILPSANTSLEFWGMANHYHFRTFTSSDSYTFSTTASYKMKGCTGNYVLKYIETNGNQYTFRLEGDLPIQTTNDMKITDSEGTVLINYSDFNHFRKIGEITTTEYQEGEFRFHNLNNKLELPKSHSLQIMVKGKGTANYTPELFALDLVANQRDRG